MTFEEYEKKKKTEGKFNPFSNGTEFMMWTDSNCDRCSKSWQNSTGLKEAPDYEKSLELIKQRKICKLQFVIDMSAIDDGVIPRSIAEQIGINKENGYESLNDPCMMFSDNDNNGNDKPNNPEPQDPNQLQLISITDGILQLETVD